MFGGGGGGDQQVQAGVVLTADNRGYDSSMQASVQQTNALAQAYDNLKAKIDRGFTKAEHISFGIAAADIASITAATVAAGRLQDQMRVLSAQNNVLNQSFGNGRQRMADYNTAVNKVRSSFGEATSSAAQLVQTISGFERAGSTQGLTALATNFEKMSQTTGENASALAQAVLTLEQTMGTGLRQTKQYSDQLVSMAEASNTSAESLARFASQIAPLGRQLNMTQSEITGFAAAFSKAGQDGYRASNVFSQMTSDIAQSLQTNSPRLAAYASLLGTTTQALKGMSGAAVTAGLFDAVGRRGASSLQTLNELGYDGLNVTRVISAVTQQSGGVGNYVRQSNAVFGDNAASAGGQTLGQQFSKLGQDLERDGEIIGSKFLPALQGVMTFVDKIAAGVTSFMQGPGGDMIAVFAAILAPVAALTGGLLSLHGALLPLMGLIALKRSSFGTGLTEGFRYGGPGPIGRAMAEDGRLEARPMVARGYGAGQRVGVFGRMGGSGDRLSPRMRWVLGADKIADAQRGAAVAATEAEAGAAAASTGIITRSGRRVAGFLHRNVVVPQVDPLIHKNPLDRQPVFGGLGAGAGKQAAESLAAAEASAAEATTGLKARLVTLAESIRETAAGFVKGSESVVASSEAMAAAQTDAAAAVTASSTKVAESMGAASIATEEAAGAIRTASVTISETAKMAAAAAGGGVMGTIRGGAAGVGAAAGIGLRGMAAGAASIFGGMGPLGWGMMGLMAAPIVMPGLSNMLRSRSGSQGPGQDDITGTGLSFPLSNVVAPLPQGGTSTRFNPMAPTPAQLYAAQQRADYTNQGVKNLSSGASGAKQAAVLFGPIFNELAAGDQQSLSSDLIKRLGPGGYQTFVNLMQSGDYSTFNPRNANVLAGRNSGLSMLYSVQSQIGQGFTNQAGTNFRGLMNTYLSADHTTDADLAPIDNPKFRNTAGFGGLAQFVVGGASTRNTNLATQHVSHGILGGRLGIGGGTSYGLTGTGLGFARQLFGGDPNKETRGDLGEILYKMPAGMSPRDQLSYILNRVSKDELGQALQNNQLAPTGDRGNDIAAVLAAINAPSTSLKSALHGLGLTDRQQHELQSLDQTNPAYYGALLYGSGISQRRLSQLAIQGGQLFPGTIGAVNAFANNQLQMLSPFMTPQQQLFGSMTGAPGMSGINAGMIATPFGSFNGQFSLLGQAQGALRVGQGLQAAGQLSGDAQAMGNLQSASNQLQQAYTQQLQTMKQYEMTLDQMNFSSREFKQSMQWQAQQQKLMVAREKQDEARGVRRAEHDFQLSRRRAEEDYQRGRKRAEEDYNLSRKRAQEDFTHQTVMMIKQSALSMHDIYAQSQGQGFTSAQFLLTNSAQQTASMQQQEAQLNTLRNMGLSTDAIQQLSLTSSSNAQELNGLFGQIQQNPALIDQINDAVQQRLTAAGALATDASSMTYQEQVHQFQVSLDRGAEDFTRSMKRAGADFDLQMHRSAMDFTRQMDRQDADFRRQLGRQAHDYNTAVSHSWTQFNDSVSNSLHQMNLAAQPLSATMKGLQPVIKAFGKDSNIGQTAAALAKAEPSVSKVIAGLNSLLNPKDKNQKDFGDLLTILTKFIKGIFGTGRGAGGGPANTAAGMGLPKDIRDRMAADHPHSGWCLRDVADVLGAPHRDPTAYAAWKNAKGFRHLMNGLIPAPIGAPIFFGPEYGGGAGHVAINAGGGMMWSEDSDNRWEKKRIWPGALGWSTKLNGATVAPSYGLQGFAKGAWDLAKDQIAQIHKGEMILPAKIAGEVRSAVSRAQVANLHTHAAPVTNYMDARSYSTVTEHTFTGDIAVQAQNPMQLAQQLKEQARIKALAKR